MTGFAKLLQVILSLAKTVDTHDEVVYFGEVSKFMV